MRNPNEHHGKDWVAIILAIGIALAINLITFAVLYDAVFSQESGLSSNATQLLTAAFGGITGILGGYVGYRASERNRSSIDQDGPSGVESDEESTPP